jgi:hypothetical protein
MGLRISLPTPAASPDVLLFPSVLELFVWFVWLINQTDVAAAVVGVATYAFPAVDGLPPGVENI